MQLKGLLCCILARYGHMCLEFKKGDIQYVYSYSRIQHFYRAVIMRFDAVRHSSLRRLRAHRKTDDGQSSIF